MTSQTSRAFTLRPDLAVTLTELGPEAGPEQDTGHDTRHDTGPGIGRTALVLHGGGGPATVAGLAGHLAATRRTVLPTHPGWDGTARPGWLADVPTLAGLYLDLLKAEGLHDVVVVGSSLGGWVAAEMTARDTDGLVGALVVIDSVGILVPEEPVTDFFALDARGVAEHSFHDPERFSIDPTTLTEAQIEQRVGNMAALRALAGDPYMHDPTLASRLAGVTVPTLVLWGESDRIGTLAYGRAFAAAIPGARFELLARAGHLPQLERPAETFAAIDGFLAGAGAAS